MATSMLMVAALPIILQHLYACAKNQVTASQLKKPRYLLVLVLMSLIKIAMFVAQLVAITKHPGNIVYNQNKRKHYQQ